MVGKYKQISRFIAKYYFAAKDHDTFNKFIGVVDARGGAFNDKDILMLANKGIPAKQWGITNTDELREWMLREYTYLRGVLLNSGFRDMVKIMGAMSKKVAKIIHLL